MIAPMSVLMLAVFCVSADTGSRECGLPGDRAEISASRDSSATQAMVRQPAPSELEGFRKEISFLGRSYEPERRAGKVALAIDAYLAQHPDSAEAYFLLGRALDLAGLLGDRDASALGVRACKAVVEAYRKAYDLQSDNRTYLLAWAEAERPKTTTAFRALSEYHRRHPDDAQACYMVAAWPGTPQAEAVALLQGMTTCLPQAKWLLARLLVSEGRLSEAETAYRSVFRDTCGETGGNWISGDFASRAHCRLGLARVLQAQGRPREALRWLRDFLIDQREFMTSFASEQETDSLLASIGASLPQWPIVVPPAAKRPEDLIEALRLAALAGDQEAFLSFLAPPLLPVLSEDEDRDRRSSCIALGGDIPDRISEAACKVRDLIWAEDTLIACRSKHAGSAECAFRVRETGKPLGVLELTFDRGSWRVIRVRVLAPD
jgi:tetratricopeptide (TPR) repeat protein